ncbi:MAG: DJ-1/PfpI family protein [Firmicutes bacterium]|nr:DJ-1/PfpI family protein [Bacillota bacterium]
MRNVVLVVAEKQFRDEEYQIPKDILTKAGFNVITASTTMDQVVGTYGLEALPDILFKDVKVKELDALIFVGGGGSSQYFDNPLAHDLAKSALDQGKIVGAICIAPVILANAGLLDGKRAAVYPDGADTLKKKGAIYTTNPVETDGLIITGNGPDAAEEFGNTLVKMLMK